MPRISHPRTCPYTICLVCEGEKTEPFFFLKLAKDLEPVSYNLITDPTVILGESASVNGRNSRHLELREGGGLPEEAHLAYPLNFVEVGKKYLENKIYDEVWVIYDKDGHPAHDLAWQSILDYRKNVSKKLNLVFSSRCIEYYLLEHFEYIDRPFEVCECKARTEYTNGRKNKVVYQNCCRTDSHHLPLAHACDGLNGQICINGYARRRHYWENGIGKSSDAYEKIISFWTGILHAHRLKWWSLASQPMGQPIYERNPYLNAYRLTLRLNEMGSLEQGEKIRETYSNGEIIVERHDDVLIVRNNYDRTFIFGSNQLKKYQIPQGGANKWEKGAELDLDVRVVLRPGDEKTIDLAEVLTSEEFIIIHFGGHEFFCALEGAFPTGMSFEEMEPTSSLFTPDN